MKINIGPHILACTVGTLVIYGLLKFESLIYRFKNNSYDREMEELAEFMISDIVLLVLFFVIFTIIQFILVIPVFGFLAKQRIFNLRNLILTCLGFSIFIGSIFGIIFGDLQFGIKNVIHSVGLFLVYFSSNFITYFKLIK